MVHAADARGARVGYGGASVDRRGYAVVPSLIPYQLNSIDVDPRGHPRRRRAEGDLAQRRAPRRCGGDAHVLKPARRVPLLINSRMPNGELLPFAATAIDGEGGIDRRRGPGQRALVVRTER
ncbi:fimbria/pilus outer membrane usher protein [Cupriavidus basilensis]